MKGTTKKLIIAILSLVLISVIMWAGVATGQGAIETPVGGVGLSIFLSMLLMDFTGSVVALIMAGLLLTLVQLLLGQSTFSLLLQVIIVIFVSIPTNFLLLRAYGSWIGFFPLYEIGATWFIATCLTAINMFFASYKERN